MKVILIFVAFGLFVLTARGLLIKKFKEEVKDLAVERISEISERSSLKVKQLHFLRGDYKIEYKKSPFVGLRWTVNRWTGEVIAWDSPQRRKRILKPSSSL